MTIDLNHFCWRERQADGRLLTPCADPMVYEMEFDMIFDTAEAAVEFVDDLMEYDPDTWVLVHYVGTICAIPA